MVEVFISGKIIRLSENGPRFHQHLSHTSNALGTDKILRIESTSAVCTISPDFYHDASKIR